MSRGAIELRVVLAPGCCAVHASSRKRSALALFFGDISYKLHFVVFFAINQFYDCFASKSVLLICKFFLNFFLIAAFLFTAVVADKGLRIHTTALGLRFDRV